MYLNVLPNFCVIIHDGLFDGDGIADKNGLTNAGRGKPIQGCYSLELPTGKLGERRFKITLLSDVNISNLDLNLLQDFSRSRTTNHSTWKKVKFSELLY